MNPTNKIILITGSTDGIGKITATALAQQGHTVIIHGRNQAKAVQVCQEIKEAYPHATVDYLIADLLSMTAIRQMAAAFQKTYTHLDVLINNAGAFFDKERQTTVDGFERTIALNLFAPFLLTQLLLNSLKQSTSARIINLYSAMHRRGGKPDFNDFQQAHHFKPARAYGLSKLYLVWLTKHWARQFQEQGIANIAVNACHPGAVATNFGQAADKGFFTNLIFRTALHFMPKPEVGAQTSIYLATSPEVEGVTGTFWGYKKNRENPDDTHYSLANEKRVWDYCTETLNPFL